MYQIRILEAPYMKNMTKIMIAGVLAVGTLAAGCQNAPSTTTPTTQTVTSNALQAYNWQLIDANRSDGDKVTLQSSETFNFKLHDC